MQDRLETWMLLGTGHHCQYQRSHHCPFLGLVFLLEIGSQGERPHFALSMRLSSAPWKPPSSE